MGDGRGADAGFVGKDGSPESHDEYAHKTTFGRLWGKGTVPNGKQGIAQVCNVDSNDNQAHQHIKNGHEGK